MKHENLRDSKKSIEDPWRSLYFGRNFRDSPMHLDIFQASCTGCIALHGAPACVHVWAREKVACIKKLVVFLQSWEIRQEKIGSFTKRSSWNCWPRREFCEFHCFFLWDPQSHHREATWLVKLRSSSVFRSVQLNPAWRSIGYIPVSLIHLYNISTERKPPCGWWKNPWYLVSILCTVGNPHHPW